MKRYKYFFSLFIFLGIIYSYFAIRVKKDLTISDIQAVKLLKVEDKCKEIKTFEDEIICIKGIQSSQLNLVKGIECRGRFIEIGSLEFIKAETGCCYDRARLTEQALKYYGFKVRHIHLNHSENIGLLNTLIPGTPSHASTEVLTSKGWMGVDSNEKFILINKNNQPVTYAVAIENGLADDLSESGFYKSPMIYIIGLYSRNGTFIKPYLPFFPELNYVDFFRNISSIKIIYPKISG